MAQPAQLPEWNTSGTNRVEPSSGLKASGHAVNSVPTSGNENWWKWTVHQWATYLKNLAAEAPAATWAADQYFTGALAGNSGVSVPATQGFKYGTPAVPAARLFSKHVSAVQFHPMDVARYPGGGETQGYFFGGGTTGNNFGARAELPGGAIITGIKALLYNTDGVARSISCGAGRMTYNASGDYTFGGSVASASLSVPHAASANPLWYDLGGVTNATIGSESMLFLRVSTPVLTTANTAGFKAFRITYTLGELVPA